VVQVTYYPGCSLEGTAIDYAASIGAVAGLLDLTLAELEDWNCCGATAAHSVSHQLSLALPARNLALAETAGQDVVVPCALCFNRLKAADKALQGPAGEQLGIAYQGGLKIWDLLDYLTQEPWLAALAQKVVRPLTGLKAVSYYGCLVARPPAVTDKADCENPRNMERLLTVLGAEPLDWSFKTDCCYERALKAGAECFVVSCQMCQANLDLPQARISKKFGKDYYLPVLYFTELMGLALGHPDVKKWLRGHLTDPVPLLRRKGLIG
jgi:heterodisulfide reductase subunit B